MKIGIDISQIVYEGTGVSRFTKGLVKSILRYGAEHTWVFFFSSFRQKLDLDLQKEIEAQKNCTIRQLFIPPRLLSFLWNDLHIFPVEMITGPLDWFTTSDWTEPPAHCKKATIVHDLVFQRYPETVHPRILKTQKKRLTWVEKESDLIFTDSRATAHDLAEMYTISEKKIQTMYPGVSLDQNSDTQNKNAVCKKYSLSGRFILTVGKLEPRKNIQRLIEVFTDMKQKGKIDSSLTLVIVGPEGWGEIKPVAHEGIRFLGFVPDDDLHALYESAVCLVYPSLYEGFGYPAVEAMLCGCPVVMSNTSSLAEIGSNGASVLFDPTDRNNMQDALIRVLSNEVLRKELVQKGYARAKEFNWKTYYEGMIGRIGEV